MLDYNDNQHGRTPLRLQVRDQDISFNVGRDRWRCGRGPIGLPPPRWLLTTAPRTQILAVDDSGVGRNERKLRVA